MNSSELSSRVEDLNLACGFSNPLNYEKLVEAAANASAEKTEKILKDLEEHKDTVKDPTAWVTSALRKATAGSAARAQSQPMSWGGGGGQQDDGKLRKRINWLNGDGGGFAGAIIYDKVLAAAGGLPPTDVMKILKELEEKKGEVKDPTAWACAAMRKQGGGNMQAPGPMTWAMGASELAWGAPMGGAAAWAAPIGGGYDAGSESKVRKRVDWLNGNGGFGNAINAVKVSEAAAGVQDIKEVMKVLKDVEENKDKVKDPTAYVTAALRKLGGGVRGGGADWAAPPMPAMAAAFGGGADWSGMPMPRMAAAWSGQPAAQDWGAPDAHSEDQKLRKRIGWLNKQGGFGGAINYDKTLQAAGGLEFAEVFRQLQQLEEKGHDSIKDPTAWLCNGLRRAAAKEGASGGGSPMPWAGGEWAAPTSQWGGGGGMGYGGPSPMDVDASNSKLHKRINWLNEKIAFDNPLNVQKVTEAASGLDPTSQMKILKDYEEKKDTIKDPTAYVTAAMRKAGGGGKGGMGKGGMNAAHFGVRRTISKR